MFDMSSGSRSLVAVLFLVMIIVGSSCNTAKKVPYFKNVPDTLRSTTMAVEQAEFKAPKIQSDDILQVNIQTIDSKSTEFMASTEKREQPGYRVDRNGNIELPLIGKVKVEGLTISQARSKIYELASQYYKNPVITVSFSNFRITVLGEVNRPGSYIAQTEKVGLLDALALAGDLTIAGKRENVMLIREGSDGSKQITRFNLNSTATFRSPYYFMQTGDIIYVEPVVAKARSGTIDQTRDRYITYISTSVTLFVAIYTILVLRD